MTARTRRELAAREAALLNELERRKSPSQKQAEKALTPRPTAERDDPSFDNELKPRSTTIQQVAALTGATYEAALKAAREDEKLGR